MIQFTVHGDPKPEPRPRAFRRGNAVGVTSGTSADSWREAIGLAAKPHAPQVPINGPVRLNVSFRFARPKYHYGTGRNAGKVKASASRYPDGDLNDMDNMLKSVMDVLTSVGVWRHDGLVVRSDLAKDWADDQPPGADIRIEEL